MIAKLGMDAHWRGAIVVATALRDAGMEVIYLGHATPEELAAVVTQEDADLLGLSSLSGNHLSECARVMEGLAAAGLGDVAVVVGGTIPPGDAAALREMGVGAAFGPGTPLSVIVDEVGRLLDAGGLQGGGPPPNGRGSGQSR